MRDFASSQIKKGVRAIGFGGDGATWGNYGLVWRDAGTTIVDYGDTAYSEGGDFRFAALGATSPPLWHGLAVYLIALNESTNEVHFSLKAPDLGPRAAPVSGEGSDTGVFSKIALPIAHGISAGVLLSYETSHFQTASLLNPGTSIRYETRWRPSGGFGLAWQPNPRLLLGLRALMNTDEERRTEPTDTRTGLARSVELRLGGSLSPWEGALVDAGVTRLDKRNAIAGTHTLSAEPNIGFEQALWARHFTFRFGVDETSPVAGLSTRFVPFNLDLAYVRNLARHRVGELFGDRSNSVIMTFTIDYRALQGRR